MAEFIVKPIQSVHSKFSYDSESYDLMKLYFETSHSESSRTTAVELFFAKIINVFKPLVIFAVQLHRECFTGF